MNNHGMDIKIVRGFQQERHSHPEIELCFVIDGQAEIRTSDLECTLRKEDMVLFNSSVAHEIHSSRDGILCFIQFSCQAVTMMTGTDSCIFSCNSVLDRARPYSELRNVLREAVYQEVQRAHQTECLLLSALYKVLDCLIENYRVLNQTDDAGADDNIRLQQIYQYINQNFQYGISMTRLAEELYLSTSSLSRFFKKKTGIYFNDYVTQVRMEYAVRQLLNTDQGITKIAVDSGFSNPSTFNRGFRDRYGMTPTDFRQKMKKEMLAQEEREQDLRKQLRQELKERFIDQALPIAGKLTVNIDGSQSFPYRKKWDRVMNVGSAANLLQASFQTHIFFLKKELNFQYGRVWSVFSKKLMLCSGREEDSYNFNRLDSILDFLLSNHMTPFLDLGNRPDIAIGELDVFLFHELDYIPFVSRRAWENCVEELLYHLVDRYGEEEVSRWVFELSSGRTNVPARDYANCYPSPDYRYSDAFHFVWRTVKTALPDAEVGGPLALIDTDQEFVTAFLSDCRSMDCKPDFVSFALFPYQTTRTDDQVNSRVPAHEGIEMNYVDQMHQLMLNAGFADCKLYITEWNNTISNRNFLNDSCFRASYIARNLFEIADSVDLVAIWMASDLMSSYYDSSRIASGGGGLLTKDDIPKPAFYALRFMNALGDRLVSRGESYLVTTSESGSYYILCCNSKWYNCSYFLKRELLNQPGDIEGIFENDDPLEISITLEGLPANVRYRVNQRTIQAQEGSLLGEWKKFRYDSNLTSADIQYIKSTCFPRLSMERKASGSGQITLNVTLQSHEIAFLHVYREAERHHS